MVCKGQNYNVIETSGGSHLMFAVEVFCNTKQFPAYCITLIPNQAFLVCFIPNRLELHFYWTNTEPVIHCMAILGLDIVGSRKVGLEASDWLITNLGLCITDIDTSKVTSYLVKICGHWIVNN